MKSFAVATALLAAAPLAYAAPSAERVAEIYSDLASGIVGWVPRYTAPDIVWDIPGTGQFNRVYNQSEYLATLPPQLANVLVEFPSYTVAASHSEGEHGDWSFTDIRVEGGVGVQGTPYEGLFTFHSKWEGETIVAINEWIDTLLLQRLVDEAAATPEK